MQISAETMDNSSMPTVLPIQTETQNGYKIEIKKKWEQNVRLGKLQFKFC